MSQSPYDATPAGAPAYASTGGGTYPESSQATLALILGILGILVVPIAAPFAWWLGGKEKSAIDAGRRDPSNRGQAVAGWVMGIIGTILLALYVVGFIALFAIGISAGPSNA